MRIDFPRYWATASKFKGGALMIAFPCRAWEREWERGLILI
jgi:hypothetical protein